MPRKLIDLDGRVDFGDEPEACKESNRSREQNHARSHDQHVAKVEYRTGDLGDIQFAVEKVNAVKEEVDSSHAWRQEWSPPPVVVLGR